MLENSFQWFVVAVDSNLRFAKQQLIKFAEGVDNGQCFFLNLSITLFSCSEGTGAKRDRLPVDFSCPVGGFCRLEKCCTKTIFRRVNLQNHGGIYVKVT